VRSLLLGSMPRVDGRLVCAFCCDVRVGWIKLGWAGDIFAEITSFVKTVIPGPFGSLPLSPRRPAGQVYIHSALDLRIVGNGGGP
jgi:hypothetical protein